MAVRDKLSEKLVDSQIMLGFHMQAFEYGCHTHKVQHAN